MNRSKRASQSGFTLVEVMITLALGLIISGGIIQVMVSNTVTGKLNRALASTQESGRFVVNRLRNELLMVGRYDLLSPDLSRAVDVVEEEKFLRNHPVVLPNDFVNRDSLGSKQGENGANDTLVVSLQNVRDCRGYRLGYLNDQEFYVVNEYFVDSGKLKCRGFDGRFLRGQKAAEGHNNHAAFTILDGVEQFQVTYGVANPLRNAGLASPDQFLSADALPAALVAGDAVVAIRMAIVLKGEGDITVATAPTFKLLNEAPYSPSDKGLYKSFETTVTLRNMKNFARSNL